MIDGPGNIRKDFSGRRPPEHAADHPLPPELIKHLCDIPTDELKTFLDRTDLEALEGLLSEGVRRQVVDIAQTARDTGGGVIALDSDGTNYLYLAAEQIQDGVLKQRACEHLAQLRVQGKLLPGGAIPGEVPQEFTYYYRVVPALVDVWRELSNHGIQIVIVSGRKAADLTEIYADAKLGVSNFTLLPSKGLVIANADGQTLHPAIQDGLTHNPMRQVADEMLDVIRDLRSDIKTDGLSPLTSSTDAKSFEELTGYRVSIQQMDGKVVLIRLHHRYRACELAHQYGCDLPNLQNAGAVDMPALSTWLQTSSAGETCLRLLEHEDKAIQRSWENIDRVLTSTITRKDHVGHRSGSQDFYPEICAQAALACVVPYNKPILAYAGDNFTDTGNDRPFMDATRELNPRAGVFAVYHLESRPESIPPWMTPATQLELFLAQYVLARHLAAQGD